MTGNGLPRRLFLNGVLQILPLKGRALARRPHFVRLQDSGE